MNVDDIAVSRLLKLPLLSGILLSDATAVAEAEAAHRVRVDDLQSALDSVTAQLQAATDGAKALESAVAEATALADRHEVGDVF